MKRTRRRRTPDHWRVGVVDIADGEYELRKLEGRPAKIVQIEREFGLRAGQLITYRANYYSRGR